MPGTWGYPGAGISARGQPAPLCIQLDTTANHGFAPSNHLDGHPGQSKQCVQSSSVLPCQRQWHNRLMANSSEDFQCAPELPRELILTPSETPNSPITATPPPKMIHLASNPFALPTPPPQAALKCTNPRERANSQ